MHLSHSLCILNSLLIKHAKTKDKKMKSFAGDKGHILIPNITQ